MGGDVSAYLNTEPVGTGAFIFSRYTTGTDLQYTANADYWAGSPQVDTLIVEMYNSSPNVTLALMAGDVDCTFGTITMSYLPQLLAQDNLKLQMYAGLGNYVVSMNMENELLQDVAVRQAMCMAIDQASLISRCEYDAVYPINMAWLPDLFGDYVNEEANAILQYDVEGASRCSRRLDIRWETTASIRRMASACPLPITMLPARLHSRWKPA